MSKNKNNSKRKSDIKNSNFKKDLTQEEKRLQDKINKKFSIIKEHKILFWLIIFPPVGLYKSYKYKIFNKWFSIILGILISIFLVLCVDVAVNPDRVTDMIIEEEVTKLGSIGEPRYVSKEGYIKDKYIVYDVLTTTGKYDLYIKIDENRNYEIDGIYKTIPNTEIIKEGTLLDENIKEIYPQILLFFNNTDNVNKFGEIEELVSTGENHQEIKTSKGTYLIEVKYDGVTSIKTYDEEGVQDTLYSRSVIVNLPKEVEKFMKKNKQELGEIQEILSCEITESNIEYIFKTDNNSYYKLEYKNDGTIILYE